MLGAGAGLAAVGLSWRRREAQAVVAGSWRPTELADAAVQKIVSRADADDEPGRRLLPVIARNASRVAGGQR